jgi:hypothetical protein
VLNKWAWKGIKDLEHRNLPALPDRYVQTNCSFRIAGDRRIERWDPVTGEITPVKVYEQNDGYYTLPLSLEPEGAAFFVFTRAQKESNITRISKNGKALTAGNTPLEVGASGVFLEGNQLEVFDKGEYKLKVSGGKEITIRNDANSVDKEILGPWHLTFQEKPLLGEAFEDTFNELISWTESDKHAIKYFSGTALYKKSFTIEKHGISKGRTYLNLGKVGDIGTVKLNGKDVGTYWKPPYIADITDYLKEGKNKLEVSVTNLWINRLIGDEKLPPEERKTSTNLVNEKGRYDKLTKPDADKYLRVSGLIGPVRIRFSKIYNL